MIYLENQPINEHDLYNVMVAKGINADYVNVNLYFDRDLGRYWYEDEVVRVAKWGKSAVYAIQYDIDSFNLRVWQVLDALDIDEENRRYFYADTGMHPLSKVNIEKAVGIVLEFEYRWHDIYRNINYVLDKTPLEASITRGYCQGDAEIVIHSSSTPLSYIDHLFWDCPIGGEFTLGNEVLHFSDLELDPYTYDEETIAESLSRFFIPEDVKKIKDALPSELSYF